MPKDGEQSRPAVVNEWRSAKWSEAFSCMCGESTRARGLVSPSPAGAGARGAREGRFPGSAAIYAASLSRIAWAGARDRMARVAAARAPVRTHGTRQAGRWRRDAFSLISYSRSSCRRASAWRVGGHRRRRAGPA
jgi:hypothetical protein